MERAIEHYQKALELNPEDQDAKYNLEFVRDEIRRRMEEAQKRQEQQQQQGQEQQGEGQKQEGDQQAEEEPQNSGDEQQPSALDSDGDGIPDGSKKKQDEADQGQQQQSSASPGELSKEEAERYLQSLEEGRPKQDQRGVKSNARQVPRKDW